ncbi:hypothetical protein [Actinomadura sp. DC4]|uniref:allene oxide cyclase barrel-like domain-containing protein n=1 Tax=Actinomadura sp. DC4 TaxID=3055069 RepID=UPI0025B11BC2|nr:hypothetical protein [Actinomadura sp. DC4]MDN3358537.1 hypothetical protein [Actinomadura sp. DC4]
MRLGKGRRTSTIAVALATIGAGGALAVTPSAQAQEHRRCVRLHLIEHTTSWYGNEQVPPGQAPPGFMAIYFGDMYDADSNALLGHSAGTNDLMYTRASDGATIQNVDEQIHLSDGSIAGSGSMSRQDVIAQKWVSEPVKGTSGRYAGLSGTWTWRLISITDPQVPVDEKFVLCGR